MQPWPRRLRTGSSQLGCHWGVQYGEPPHCSMPSPGGSGQAALEGTGQSWLQQGPSCLHPDMSAKSASPISTPRISPSVPLTWMLARSQLYPAKNGHGMTRVKGVEFPVVLITTAPQDGSGLPCKKPAPLPLIFTSSRFGDGSSRLCDLSSLSGCRNRRAGAHLGARYRIG